MSHVLRCNALRLLILQQTAFTQGTFYILLHIFSPETFYTRQLLQQRPYTKEAFYTKSFTPNTFCHQKPFAPNTFYTRHILHQIPLTPDTFYTRHFLNHAPYPPEQCFHENSLGRSWLNILDTIVFGISRYFYFSWQ